MEAVSYGTCGPGDQKRPSLYERDFYMWIEQQAARLREGRLDEIDVANLLEEIEDMGRSEKRAIESNLVVLLTHLIKYRTQRDQRSSSWRGSIVEHRRRLRKLLRESPSLDAYAHEIFAECYADGCEQAAADSGCPQRPSQANRPSRSSRRSTRGSCRRDADTAASRMIWRPVARRQPRRRGPAPSGLARGGRS